MPKASWDTSKNYNTIYDLIKECGLSGTDVLDMFVNWHGLQLLSEEFTQDVLEEAGFTEDEDEE